MKERTVRDAPLSESEQTEAFAALGEASLALMMMTQVAPMLGLDLAPGPCDLEDALRNTSSLLTLYMQLREPLNRLAKIMSVTVQ